MATVVVVNEDEVYNMASNAGCITGNIPFNYLGLPIGSNMKSIANWKILIDRFRSRLLTWKASSSDPYQVCVRKSRHLLSLIFRAPESVLNDLERIRSNFFWGVLKLLTLLFSKNGAGEKLFTSPNDLCVKVVKAFHGHKGGFDNNGCSFK
ncbi:hypothetical protein Tco_0253760, partial [Tanacetum coccineum]